MEFEIRLWMGMVMGWRNRILVIKDDSYVIKRIKSKKLFSNLNSVSFFLQNATVHDCPANPKAKKSEDSELEFVIKTYEAKNVIRARTKEDKTTIINKLNSIIQVVNSKSAFSNDYENYKIEIAKQFRLVNPFNSVALRLTHFQNLFLEFNKKLDTLKFLINEKNIKNKQNEFVTVHCNMVTIKEEMKKQFDELISKIYDYHDLIEGDEGYGTMISNSRSKRRSKHEHHDSQSDIINSSELSTENEDTTMISSDEESRTFKSNTFSRLSNNISDFNNKVYSWEPRTQLPKSFSCGNNLVKEFIKSMTNKKGSLPIYFNEPITMLQKQCERFYYMDLLTKADSISDTKIQMCYISAFLIGEIFLSLGRILKPFNPILGETYEFYDNKKHFRFFSEQVSHNPPISAYIGETPSFALYGDTRATTSFKILKGCLELSFSNKTHLYLKKQNKYFVFNKPSIYMKGLIKAPVHNDYGGEVVIQSIEEPNVRCVLTFIEETKKPIGSFEGKVYAGEEVVYAIGGNWNSDVYYMDSEGNDKKMLLVLNRNERYIDNNGESYLLPLYTYGLNQSSEELEKTLPKCDSRMRPDLKEYEGGDNDKAQELKHRIEHKQRVRHQMFEEEKVQYTPNYFVNEYNDKSEDYVYLFNGKYWNDKANGKIKELKESDIFDTTDIII